MSFVEMLRRIAAKLEQSNIPYMITGSIAASYYGLTRATQALDIVISASAAQLKSFIGLLPPDQYYADLQDALDAHRHQSMFNVLDMSTGWKVDIIFQKSAPFHEEAFRRRKAVTFEGVPTSMISGEDLILAKLEWSKMGESERQVRDTAIVLQKTLAGTRLQLHRKVGPRTRAQFPVGHRPQARRPRISRPQARYPVKMFLQDTGSTYPYRVR